MRDGRIAERNVDAMDGKTKAAVFLACLGADKAGRVLATMSDTEVEEMTLKLSSLESVDSEVRASVLGEFYKMALENKVVTRGGVDYARSLLNSAFGSKRGEEILSRLKGDIRDIPFKFLKRADPLQIVSFIQDEHPQTISLILAHLPPATSAMVLTALDASTQGEVVARIATMEQTPPEVLREVERVLERKMASIYGHGFTIAGGVQEVADILNSIDRAAEKSIMAKLEADDPELAEEISRLMFVFEDLNDVDDSGIQKALREVDSKDLALALKGASDTVREKIFRNMSARARAMIEDELEFLGPVRLRNVEEAQMKVVSTIRALEESGDVIIDHKRRGDDEVVV